MSMSDRSHAPLPGGWLADSGAQVWVVAATVAGILGLTAYIFQTLAWQPAQNFLMGCLLGFALYRAAFGFTGPWRNLVVHGKGTGTRKTLVMLAAAAVTMMLLGTYGGYPQVIHGFGWSLVIGAFLFGMGMQLGGCCGSGTAYVAGGGSARVWITFAFFIVGSVWGSVDAPAWWQLPVWARVSMSEMWGVWPAIAVTLGVLALLYILTLAYEKARTGGIETSGESNVPLVRRALVGPWSPMSGGILMGVLTGLVLVVTLAPWGITFGYTIYGAKIATAIGIDLAAIQAPFTNTAFWAQDWAKGAIAQPIWSNNAANMNIGIILGAALAAALVGKWRPTLKGIPLLSLLAAALGGIMMGYGARISTGCNIGAMVNGIASGSLHGWVWMGAAILGNLIMIPARPWFRMSN